VRNHPGSRPEYNGPAIEPMIGSDRRGEGSHPSESAHGATRCGKQRIGHPLRGANQPWLAVIGACFAECLPQEQAAPLPVVALPLPLPLRLRTGVSSAETRPKIHRWTIRFPY
jgi:hypothetical protein